MKLDYLLLNPEHALPRMDIRPFRAVLIAEKPASAGWRNEVAGWLVNSGCLYFIAWGENCEEWHDSVDWSVLENFDFGEIPNDQFVMTTWHANEPLSEVFWFAGNCASHPDVELDETVLVHVSDKGKRRVILDAYRDSQHTPS